MEAKYLDHYSYLSSPIHRIGAPMKLAVGIGVVFLSLLIPVSWEWFHLCVWGFILAVLVSSRLPVGGLIGRLRWMWLAVLVLAAGRIWQEEGWYLFASALIKGSEALLVMALIANTTRFPELMQVLSGIGTPAIFVTTLSLMYRYLFVLADEKNRMLRARRSRTFVTGRWRIWQLQANIISHLFVRSVDRAQRIHAAMSARGMVDS